MVWYNNNQISRSEAYDPAKDDCTLYDLAKRGYYGDNLVSAGCYNDQQCKTMKTLGVCKSREELTAICRSGREIQQRLSLLSPDNGITIDGNKQFKVEWTSVDLPPDVKLSFELRVYDTKYAALAHDEHDHTGWTPLTERDVRVGDGAVMWLPATDYQIMQEIEWKSFNGKYLQLRILSDDPRYPVESITKTYFFIHS